MKKNILFILAVIMIMSTACNRDTNERTGNNEGKGYIPFMSLSQSAEPNDDTGYTESMPLKKILSDFEYGAESYYNPPESNSVHGWDNDTDITSTKGLYDNANVWTQSELDAVYILNAPDQNNYENMTAYKSLRIVICSKSSDVKPNLEVRVFNESTSSWQSIGTAEYDANIKQEIVFSLEYASERDSVSKIAFHTQEGIVNELYYIDIYSDASPKSDISIGDLDIATEFLGNVLATRYGPYSASGFYDSEDKKWKIWYGCGIEDAICSDNVYYIETDDPKGVWSKPVRIIPEDKTHMLVEYNKAPGYGGDPSVIKVDGTYYMYFSGLVRSPESLHGHHNEICLATSNDGINFTVYDKFVVPSGGAGIAGYGNGAPSAVYKDGKFYLYYFSASSDVWGCYMRSSDNGYDFSEAVLCQTYTLDVKYIDSLDIWVGTYYSERNQEGRQAPGVRLAYSKDGVTWTRGKTDEALPAQDMTAQINHNPGLIGDEHGHGFTTMFYTYGNNDLSLAQPNVYMSTLQYDMRELEWGRLTIK